MAAAVDDLDGQKDLDFVREVAGKLPKVELHLHLDGSLPPKFIANAAKNRNIKLPEFASDFKQDIGDTYDHAMRQWIMIQKMKIMHNQSAHKNGKYSNYYDCDLANYIDANKKTSNWLVFDFMNQFLQSKQELYDATYDIVNHLYFVHNTQLIELRFCPSLHCGEKLSEESIIESVLKGFNQARKDILKKCQIMIQGGIILCALRSLDSSHSLNMIKLCEKFIKNGSKDDINVIGFDIAGKEDEFPLKLHESSLKYGTENGIPITVHAGEWPNTLDNIRLATLTYKVNRIGHAINLQHDAKLAKQWNDLNKQRKMKGENVIGIECCLTSNVGSGTKAKSFEDHPISHVFLNEKNDHFCVSLSSDNLFLSGNMELVPSSTNEIVRFVTQCNGTWKQVKKLLMDGIELSFDERARQKEFRSQFEKQIDHVFKQYKLE